MNMTKTLLCAAVAGAMAFAASKASAATYVLPLVKLNLSGVITGSAGTTNDNGTVTKGSPFQKYSFNNQKLIDLLNASPTFQKALTNQFGSTSSNQVPEKSYIVWNIYTDSLIITNKNGFSFDLDNNNSEDSFGYIEIYYDYLIGTFTRNDKTGSGNEQDLTGVYIYIYDYNGNEIESYGAATFNWSYAAMSVGYQKSTLSATITGGNYYAELKGNNAAPTQFKASGSGTANDPIGQNPFYKWY